MKHDILVSVVTVCWNPGEKISNTIESVINQSYKNIEYIIIDGNSTDDSGTYINKYKNNIHKFISEYDTGIYNAMNKGISLCNGEIIGILNAGDTYEVNAIECLVNEFKSKGLINAVYYGGINKININNKVIAKLDSSFCDIRLLSSKMSMFHTASFITKFLYDKYGNYLESYKISSDFDLLRRYYKQNVPFIDLRIITTNMLEGGLSEKFSSIFRISHELSLIKCNNIHSFKYFFFYLKISSITILSFLKKKFLH
jgi:glycosyltransferase involved in cell wall biosynthesis